MHILSLLTTNSDKGVQHVQKMAPSLSDMLNITVIWLVIYIIIYYSENESAISSMAKALTGD